MGWMACGQDHCGMFGQQAIEPIERIICGPVVSPHGRPIDGRESHGTSIRPRSYGNDTDRVDSRN